MTAVISGAAWVVEGAAVCRGAKSAATTAAQKPRQVQAARFMVAAERELEGRQSFRDTR